jgi:glycosyltransferase involved in cell wall biosynthesis
VIEVPLVHLITELDSGGAQTALLRYLTHHDRSRYRPTVVCLYNGDQVVAQQIRALGIGVVDVGLTRPYRLDALWRLYKLLREERPSILHCWMVHANLLGRLVGRLARLPVIITSRRNVEIGGPWRERAKRLTRRLDDAVIAVCELARQVEIERTGAAPDKVVTIYNGIDPFPAVPSETVAQLRHDFGLRSDAPVAICVSRLHPQKGHEDLLAAWRRVTAVYPHVDLLIVGDGRRRSELERLAARQSHVHFTGQRDDVAELLALSDLLILPSLWEGLPNVVLEAMAAGLPVVATAVGGTPELVIDGKTGLLVPPRDPAALAQAILALLTEPDLAQRLGENGRLRVADQFTIRQMVQQTEQLYQRLLAEKRVRS